MLTLAFWPLLVVLRVVVGRLQQIVVVVALGLLKLFAPHVQQVLSSVRMVSLFQMIPPPALLTVTGIAAPTMT